MSILGHILLKLFHFDVQFSHHVSGLMAYGCNITCSIYAVQEKKLCYENRFSFLMVKAIKCCIGFFKYQFIQIGLSN